MTRVTMVEGSNEEKEKTRGKKKKKSSVVDVRDQGKKKVMEPVTDRAPSAGTFGQMNKKGEKTGSSASWLPWEKGDPGKRTERKQEYPLDFNTITRKGEGKSTSSRSPRKKEGKKRGVR